ncbi:MAG: MFS transporter [Clostridiales Family XIII bacterium]|jgi:predicted MFS family arabinose efflux permease|nr:MFS transporter [Clostridiales Family XIII bacterium]
MGTVRERFFYAAVLLFWFAQYIYIPFLNPFMSVIGISATVIGVIGGVYGVTQMALRIPLSIGASLVPSHKPIILAGLAAVAVSCVLPLFSHSWVAFFILRALAGVSSSTWISYTAYLLEGAGEAANSRMGLIMACNTGGICSSQIVGTVLYDRIGMDGLFTIAALAAATGVILILMTPFRRRFEKSEARKRFDVTEFTGAIRNKRLWICSVLMSLGFWVMFSTNYGFTGVFGAQALGASSVQLGLIAFVCQIASVVVSLVFGKLKGRRLPERNLIVIAFILFGVYCALSPECGDANALIMLQILGGVAVAVPNVLLFANAGRELSKSQQILAMGIFQSVYSVGMTAGPVVSGVIVDASGGGFAPMFYALAAVSGAAAVLTRVLYRD